MIIALIVTVLLFRFCVAALVSACLARQEEGEAAVSPQPAHAPAAAPASPRVLERPPTTSPQVMTMTVPTLSLTTSDDESVRVDAIVYFRVTKPGSGADGADQFSPAIARHAQATLRSAIAASELTQVIGEGGLGGPEHRLAGPQDAPLPGPRDETGRPQDAVLAVAPFAQVEEPSLRSLITGKGGMVELVSALAAQKGRGATHAFQEYVSAVQSPSLLPSREAASGERAGSEGQPSAGAEKCYLDALPRPLTGPAYFGGRDDDEYLFGWDEAVECARRGYELSGPSWGSAAYMTGWKDGAGAIESARCS